MLTRFDLGYYLLSPAALPYLAYRRLRKGKYRQSARAMFGGMLPRGPERDLFRNGSIWIHAVSVGETVAAKCIAPLLREAAPSLPLVVTTITETGQAHARKILSEAADHINYFPVDLSWNVARFLDCFRPRVVVLMEAEIWPNFLTLAARGGARIFMVNGKLSDRSYRHYRRGLFVLRPVFDAVRAFCMQTDADAARMRDLCGRPCDVHVTGNVKFDASAQRLSAAAAEAFRERFRLGPRRPTVVVGSTHAGEDEIMLAAFERARRAVPDLQMILSPRHPERFGEVADLCRRVGSHQTPAGGWKVSRASAPDVDSPDILVLDTMGDLARVYGLGDVAVVAGSFCGVGGHNLMEAAAHAIPVVVGPDMHSQKEIDRLFEGPAGGCVRCTAETLGETLESLFSDAAKRAEIGAQAARTAARNQGSARRSVDVIRRYL